MCILVTSLCCWIQPGTSAGQLQMLPSIHHKNAWNPGGRYCGIISIQNSNVTNLFQGPRRHYCIGTVECASEPISCRPLQSHWYHPAPSAPPDFCHLHISPYTNDNPTFTHCVSSLIIVQEHITPCPCAHVRLPTTSNSLAGAHLPCSPAPVAVPRPICISEGDPQSSTISEGES
jgi:hypothetical protein